MNDLKATPSQYISAEDIDDEYDKLHAEKLALEAKIEEVLELLRRGEIDATRYRKLRVKTWSEGGITIVKEASSVKLGHECLSHERLDAALDCEKYHE